jgi:hypothetical protein
VFAHCVGEVAKTEAGEITVQCESDGHLYEARSDSLASAFPPVAAASYSLS